MKNKSITYINLYKMKFNIIQIIFIILLSINSVNAQTYYGKKDFGKFEFVNDSVCTVSFICGIGVDYFIPFIDTISYIKKGDTIFISTNIKRLFEVSNIDKKLTEDTNINPYFMIIKKYSKIRGKYKFQWESVIKYNKYRNYFDFDEDIYKDDVVVIQLYGIYKRFIWKDKNAERFRINVVGLGSQDVFFDSFPLLIKGKKLIPIIKEKNNQCWIENGFYFPVMKESNKTKEYKTIVEWTIGLKGLPNEFDIK